MLPGCFLHEFYTPVLGERIENAALLERYLALIQALPAPEAERAALSDFVRFQLVGERSRWMIPPDWLELTDFAARATAFEAGVERAVAALADPIAAEGVLFDAVVTTTSTGGLMPGISYRLAHRLGSQVRPHAVLLDLAHAGCTGSLKLLQVARSLAAHGGQVLAAAVELPSTLAEGDTTARDVWQGNCTFGDGCVALRVSRRREDSAAPLELEHLGGRQFSGPGLDLISWKPRRYYTFSLRDEKSFDAAVRQFVVETLAEREGWWKETPRWVLHPAGIALLVRLSRKLGIPAGALDSTVRHYREFSNQSSVSLLQILAVEGRAAGPEEAINLLSMGAGFEVYYGRVRKHCGSGAVA